MARPKKNPRLKYYPHHEDYKAMPNEFRPFVLAVGRPNYKSDSLNLNRFGLREQYDADGRLIDFETLAQRYERCNVLVGNSTTFGVDATSDKTTLGGFLNEPDVPCINLSVRGAMSQQELILFQQMKRFLPPIDNVIVVTGINNCSIAFVSDAILYPEYGGVFSEQYYYNRFFKELKNQYDLFHTPLPLPDFVQERFLAWVNTNFFDRFEWVRRWAFNRFGRDYAPAKPREAMAAEPKLDMMLDFARNDIETWGCMQTGLKNRDGDPTRVHIVLQPCVGWTSKSLTAKEREMFEYDNALLNVMGQYTQPAVYEQCRLAYKQAAQDAGLDFHDMNEWLDDPQYASRELFTDVCHLTDEGNRLMANLLRQHLNWQIQANSEVDKVVLC